MEEVVHGFSIDGFACELLRDGGALRLVRFVRGAPHDLLRVRSGGGLVDAVVRELAALATTAARDRADCDTARATRDAAIGRAMAAERELAALDQGRWRLSIPEGCKESLQYAERRFRYGDPEWEWMIDLNPPSLARNKGNGFGWHEIDARDPEAPPLAILAEQFAKLGRDFSAPLLRQARDEAESRGTLLTEASRQNDVARERIAELEAQLDGSAARNPEWRDFQWGGKDFRIRIPHGGFSILRRYGDSLTPVGVTEPGTPDAATLIGHFIALADQQCDNRLRDRIAALRAEVADLTAKISAALAADDSTGRELGRIEAIDRALAAEALVADLTARLEEQKARADRAEAKAEKWRLDSGRWLVAHDEQRARADGLVKIGVAATEAMNEEWSRAEAAEQRLADLESRQVSTSENLAAGCIAAVQARAEGDPRRIVQVATDERTLYALAADGSLWHQANRAWCAEPPLPPIDPEIKIAADGCEPDPLDLARHDWRTNRGRVSCERCGTPFRKGLENQSCGAQP